MKKHCLVVIMALAIGLVTVPALADFGESICEDFEEDTGCIDPIDKYDSVVFVISDYDGDEENELVSTTDQSERVASCASVLSEDVDVSVTMQFPEDGDPCDRANDYCGSYAGDIRVRDTGSSYYYVSVSARAGKVLFAKMDGGWTSYWDMDEISTDGSCDKYDGCTIGTPHPWDVRVVLEGYHAKVYVDGVLKIHVTDPDPLTEEGLVSLQHGGMLYYPPGEPEVKETMAFDDLCIAVPAPCPPDVSGELETCEGNLGICDEALITANEEIERLDGLLETADNCIAALSSALGVEDACTATIGTIYVAPGQLNAQQGLSRNPNAVVIKGIVQP